jgi:glucokinase
VGIVDGLSVVFERRYNADFSALCHRLPPDQAGQSIQDSLASVLEEVMREYPSVRGIGIGFPGFIDPETMVVASSPNLPGLLNVDIARPLSARLGCPVIVENDGLAAAYGEHAVRPEHSPGLIYLGLGTGVGGGLIVNHEAYAGEHGVAMEVGHLIVEPGGRLCGCGNRGCMEQYASASGVTLSHEALTGQHLDAAAIAKLAEQGDISARQAYVQAGDRLGQVLAHILKLVDVGCVVIGGGMRLAWPLMEPAFSQRLDADLIPVLRGKIAVHISNVGDQAGMIGAALLAA